MAVVVPALGTIVQDAVKKEIGKLPLSLSFSLSLSLSLSLPLPPSIINSVSFFSLY